MANAIKWTDVSTVTLVIAGDASSPTLKNLADGGDILSNEIDPASAWNQYANFRLRVRGATAPTAGNLVQCYFVLDVGDAGAYEDGGSGTIPQRNPDFLFASQNVSTQQVIRSVPWHVLIPACPFKVLLVNNLGVAFTNTNDENQLHYSVYNDEIQ